MLEFFVATAIVMAVLALAAFISDRFFDGAFDGELFDNDEEF